jgi:hypothetical protein
VLSPILGGFRVPPGIDDERRRSCSQGLQIASPVRGFTAGTPSLTCVTG